MKIGAYSLEKKINVSGMMNIYTGSRIKDNLPVTVSVMMKQHVFDDTLIRRLTREYDCARSVDSSYVVKYLDLIQSDKSLAIVTECQPEMNLKAYLSLGKDMPLENIIKISAQIALGLNTCHLAGVVHRNVTPENIYIGVDKKIKIANFGLASMLNASTLTMTGTMIGSPEYAPPENLYSSPRDIRGDIYSLGIIMWEMLTGENPFEGKNITEIIHQKHEDHLPRASTLNPDVPSWLDILIESMTASDPDERVHALYPVVQALKKQQHINRPLVAASGNCFACGYMLSNDLNFCHFCGKPKSGNKHSSDSSVILITNIQKTDETAAFLKRSFHDPPSADLPTIFKRSIVPLVENVSGSECRWLADSLRKMGCAVEIRPMAAWYYKLSACIGFCMLLIFHVLVHVKPHIPDPSIQEIPVTVASAYWFIKLFSILIISGVMALLIRLHYSPVHKLPKTFVNGALSFNPFAKHINFSIGMLSSIIIIAGTIAIMMFTATAMTALIMSFAEWYTQFYWWQDLRQTSRGQFINIGHLLLAGQLIIIYIIVGRVYIPPIFKSHARGEDKLKNLHARTDHELMERLRGLVSIIYSKDYRYLIAESLEQYLYFKKLKDKSIFSKSRVCQDLQAQLIQSLETIGSASDQIKRLVKDASEEMRMDAENKQRRIQQHLSQLVGDTPKALQEEWKKAQDSILRHESAVDLLAEFLNKLRMVVGSMHTATVQLSLLDQGKASDEREIIHSMSMLSETLKVFGK